METIKGSDNKGTALCWTVVWEQCQIWPFLKPSRGRSQWFSGICDLQDEPVQISQEAPAEWKEWVAEWRLSLSLSHQISTWCTWGPASGKSPQEPIESCQRVSRAERGEAESPLWTMNNPGASRPKKDQLEKLPSSQPPHSSPPQYKPRQFPGVYSPDSAIYFYLLSFERNNGIHQ